MVDPSVRGLAAAVFALMALVGLSALAVPPAAAQELQPLTIVTDDGEHHFQVELAATEEDRSRGLMYRRSMPADHGMLFDFERIRPVSMWMRNTYIPLDMLFIDADGTIVRIAQDTEPLSERSIRSGQPVLSVLELNGGTARRLGIAAGDRVEHPLFAR
ncbi:DUF192 domain-containing protein [Salinarimonas chemoclinalis]|uniref:DUF192 domain-containing protein n=1 Tax=Salinarimonas chemoclinalis TaxID=3241599 RepID=UPI003556521C